MEKISYALGLSLGSNFLQSGINKLDYKELVKGIEDVLEQKTPKMSQEEVQNTINTFFESLKSEISQKNIKEGEDFLLNNAKREEVTVLDSGLQYEVITKGEGAIPKATDNVKVHYHGSLIDGTVFDSSVERGQPASFGVTQVIPGWVEALQLMPVGSKWKLFIPSNLAYGEQGAGQTISPNSTLVFDVELLDIV